MLEIYLIDQESPSVCFMTIEELLRTAHVVGEVPFIKPTDGVLINLTAVVRLVEIEESELSTDEARAALEDERLVAEIPRRPRGGAVQWWEG